MSAVLGKGAKYTQTQQAKAGVAQHTVAEQVLKGERDNAFSAVGEVFERTIVFDKQAASTVQAYVNHVKSVQGDEGRLWVEKKFDLSRHFGREEPKEIVGLGDSIVWVPSRTLHVFDLKAGATPVAADNNPQLLAYGVGAVFLISYLVPIDRVELSIFQGGYADTYKITPDGLVVWQNYATKRIAQAHELDALYTAGKTIERKHYAPSTSNCKWCKGKAKCPYSVS